MTTKKNVANENKNGQSKQTQSKNQQPKTAKEQKPIYEVGKKAKAVSRTFGRLQSQAADEHKSGPAIWIRRMNSKEWHGDKATMASTEAALALVGASKWDMSLLDWFGGKVATFSRMATAEESAALDEFVDGETDKVVMADGRQWVKGEVVGIGEGWSLSKITTQFDDRVIIRSAKAKALRVAKAEDKAVSKSKADEKAQKSAAEKAQKEAERKAKKAQKDAERKAKEDAKAEERKRQAMVDLGITIEQYEALMAMKAAQ